MAKYSRVRAVGLSSAALLQQQQQQPAYAPGYDQPGAAAGPPDIGVRGRLITLISAVRTLLRCLCSSFSGLSCTLTADPQSL
jgi:hypothetical protein